MSAETLRSAAALMRERAEAATEGPWAFNSSMENERNGPNAGWVGRDHACQEYVCGLSNHPDGLNDGLHIASWHPAVALAVAQRLDTSAWQWEQIDKSNAWGDVQVSTAHLEDDLAIALAYLGGDQ